MSRELRRASGEQDDRDVTVLFDPADHFIQMICDDEAAPNKDIIHCCFNRFPAKIVRLSPINLIRVDQNGKGFQTFGLFI